MEQWHRQDSQHLSTGVTACAHNFLHIAREKREKLLRKVFFHDDSSQNGQILRTTGGWQPTDSGSHRTSPRSDYTRRTPSVDSLSSGRLTPCSMSTVTSSTNTLHPDNVRSEASTVNHRASPCPSEMSEISFSYSNPKYFVRTAIFQPVSASSTRPTAGSFLPLLSADKVKMNDGHRSPAPGPDYDQLKIDSLTLEELVKRLTPSCTNTPEDNRSGLLKNYLSLLAQWTKTFPYDFRNPRLMSQLQHVAEKITRTYPLLKLNVNALVFDLSAKLTILDKYEQYLTLVNNETGNRLNTCVLTTDIYEQCPCPKQFAHQLTFIELDRLKPIGAEEFIEYFAIKIANEEARARPECVNATTTTNEKQAEVDKWSFSLESYISWSNRLGLFVTTEIIKHLKRHIRVKLINYFIDAALECFNTGNFNSMMGILG
ncbi:unnamed protein product [Didymodactylos carnosus]|uniref:Ras-GEF domain-containing protein n=1 Tax=Didymodactylos carnosus TaxID=1234261 RepID=A0A813V0Q5_9BILA|nr:unnamed protein product [Didymodactylos carnosus]CAF3623813.1 unnamed protein product [Didymodactylos carnosus]